MNKIIIGCAVTAAALSIGVGSAAAEGGGGRSACSNNGVPDGVVVLGIPGTYDSPGEVVSSIAPNLSRPGQVVRVLCAP